jgi:heme exporter protein C
VTTQVSRQPDVPPPGGAPLSAPAATGGPVGTGSPATRVLGVVILACLAVWAFLGLLGTPPDEVQGDAVRLMYIHVPVVTVAYLATILGSVASGIWLWKRTEWWDTLASSAVELAVLFTAGTLLTGSIWGGAAWGQFWVWDARITSTALLFLLQLGYLALRRVPATPDARARRSAILGLLLAPNILIINQSVNWWRSVHQTSTVFQASLKTKIHDLMLFEFGFSMVVALLVFTWLLIHRFRVGWLQNRVEEHGLARALDERRAEADEGVS